MLLNKYEYCNNFGLLEEDVEELVTRLHIGKSIITFNANRLRTFCCYLIGLHELFRRNIVGKRDRSLQESVLTSKQMALALEFFLNMDRMSF